VRELDAAHVEALLDAQQPAVDQRRERVGGAPAAAKRFCSAPRRGFRDSRTR
jgi:hypothetical protein